MRPFHVCEPQKLSVVFIEQGKFWDRVSRKLNLAGRRGVYVFSRDQMGKLRVT